LILHYRIAQADAVDKRRTNGLKVIMEIQDLGIIIPINA